MGYDKNQEVLHKTNERFVDKQLGFRYRSNEALPGESYRDFKTRVIREEIESIRKQANKIYPAWVRMPNETEQEFKRRWKSASPDSPPTYPAWKRMPGESDEDFQKRFVSKKLDTRI